MASSDTDDYLLSVGTSTAPTAAPENVDDYLLSRAEIGPAPSQQPQVRVPGMLEAGVMGAVKGIGDLGNSLLRGQNFLYQNVPPFNMIPGAQEHAQASNAEIDQSNRDYQAEFGGNPLAKGMRMASNVAAVTPFTMNPAGQGALFNATAGAGASALLSGGNNDSLIPQMVWGGAGGAALPALFGAAGRALNPTLSAGAAYLRNLGVDLTPGQLMGGAASRIEQGLTSIPVVGDMIRNRLVDSFQSLNRAVGNEVLAPLRMNVPENIQPGQDTVNYINRVLGDNYDQVLARGGLDPRPLIPNLQSIASQTTHQLPQEQADAMIRIIQNKIIDAVRPGQFLAGDTYKGIDSELRHAASTYAKSNEYWDRELGLRLDDVRGYLRREFDQQNPEIAGELAPIDAAYARYKRMESASAAQAAGKQDGVFTPEQLLAAVRRGDQSKDKRQFAGGNALLQETAGAANQVMGNKVPDSGTPFRLNTVGPALLGLGGVEHFAPTYGVGIGLGALAGTLAYSQPGQRVLNALLSQRPGVLRNVGGVLSEAAPYSVGGGGALMNALLGPAIPSTQ